MLLLFLEQNATLIFSQIAHSMEVESLPLISSLD